MKSPFFNYGCQATSNNALVICLTCFTSRLDVLGLARVTGHRDIRQLLTYYNKIAEDLARQIANQWVLNLEIERVSVN